MAAERSETRSARREPVQARSRERVERLLDAAEQLVVERGVEALSTRDVATAAGVPVASLYQYFADKDAVLLALVERHMAEMDEQVAADVGHLAQRPQGPADVGELVATVMRAFVAVYARRPAFVELYLRGRTNAAVHAYGREHNARVAEALREHALEAGLARPDLPLRAVVLAVEVGDRVFQLAYEHDLGGDQETVEEGVRLVTAYLERYAAAPLAGAGASRG